jgi:hypothetical protein
LHGKHFPGRRNYHQPANPFSGDTYFTGGRSGTLWYYQPHSRLSVIGPKRTSGVEFCTLRRNPLFTKAAE